MVTCTIQGGLANCLFQIAMVLGYSLKHGIDYCIPLVNINPHYKGQKPYIFPGVKYCNEIAKLPMYKEKGFTYEEIPYMDNVCFESNFKAGGFQSWKYFGEYREEILKAFAIPYEKNEGTISIHIRRGDYVRLKTFHPPVTTEYIFSAIDYFKERGYKKFLVFSDDIDWCYGNISAIDGCEINFSEGRTELEDLALASSCEHNIGSNSTYSLWLHYLNQNPDKIGVFPQKWFGPSINHDTKDLLLPNSILL